MIIYHMVSHCVLELIKSQAIGVQPTLAERRYTRGRVEHIQGDGFIPGTRVLLSNHDCYYVTAALVARRRI